MALRHLAVAAFSLSLLALVPAATAAPPSPPIPCQSGIAGTDCGVGAGSCSVGAGYRTGSDPYQYARVHCGPPTFSGCTVYTDTRGNVQTCVTG